jgi:peptidoglycan/LPS O-acetylase OafA/YrhL
VTLKNLAADRPHYARYIDGLRAVAVVSVIAYHLNAALLPGGFIGVDIFFVISGFVVSASVGQLEGISMRQFLLFFYARRLFRIAPALIVCLVATAFAFALLVPVAWLSGTNQKTGLLAFFGLSNFVLANTDNDYFSPRVGFNPFTHTWSLAVEEQFYLVFPWLFIGWLRRRRYLSLAQLSLGCTASFVWAWHLGGINPDRAFYLITSRFWELGAGVLLFQVMALSGHPFGSPLPRSPVATIGATVSAAVLSVGLIIVSPSSTPFPGGILPVLGTVGILGFLQGRSQGGWVLRVLNITLLASSVKFHIRSIFGIGRCSYCFAGPWDSEMRLIALRHW